MQWISALAAQQDLFKTNKQTKCLFFNIFLSVLGLPCCGLFFSFGKQGLLSVVCEFLFAAVSLAAAPRF